MKFEEGKDQVIRALQWAIDQGIQQHFGEYIDAHDFYDDKPVEECSMCAAGVVYAYIFNEKPRTSASASAKLNATHHVTNVMNKHFENNDVIKLISRITSRNDRGHSFSKILDFVEGYDLNHE